MEIKVEILPHDGQHFTAVYNMSVSQLSRLNLSLIVSAATIIIITRRKSSAGFRLVINS